MCLYVPDLHTSGSAGHLANSRRLWPQHANELEPHLASRGETPSNWPGFSARYYKGLDPGPQPSPVMRAEDPSPLPVESWPRTWADNAATSAVSHYSSSSQCRHIIMTDWLCSVCAWSLHSLHLSPSTDLDTPARPVQSQNN